ncbi:MAG: ATP-binding protein [Melioribacter sp.]|nr:ATP-binding protein [Melioribacter sp.]
MKKEYRLGILNRNIKFQDILRRYRIIFYSVLVFWTILMTFLLLWKIYDLKNEQKNLVLNEVKIITKRDTSFINWTLVHGGYCVLNYDSNTVFKKYLGEKLKGLSTKNIGSQKLSDEKIIVRTVGINPINPNNNPDEFEREALQKFKSGAREIFATDTINGKNFFRYVFPLNVKKECLICHAKEGYKIGEIKGAYSIAISTSNYEKYLSHQIRNDAILHFVIWLIGLFGALVVFKALFKYANELKLSQEQFYEFLDNAPLSAFIKDKEGNIVYMNKVAEESLPEQYRDGKWKGLKDSDIWPKDIVESLRKNDLEVLTTMKSKVFEETTVSDGKRNVWLTHKFPFKDNSDGNVYIIGIEIDITERKEKEEEIKKYMKKLEEINKNKDKFISMLAHDLRSPFTPILGYTDLLATSAEYLTYQEIKEYAHSLDIIVKNQFQLLENILDWSRLESGRLKLEPTELNLFDEVKKVINLYQPFINDKEIKIIEKIDPSYEIVTDQHSLNTILRNLISNAIKFTPRKGEIRVLAAKENGFYKIQIIDTGVGISAENITKIFGGVSGYTTRGTNNEKGTGLGLSICKELVEKLGGKIWVESEVGKGSTFSFIIPNMKIEEK